MDIVWNAWNSGVFQKPTTVKFKFVYRDSKFFFLFTEEPEQIRLEVPLQHENHTEFLNGTVAEAAATTICQQPESTTTLKAPQSM